MTMTKKIDHYEDMIDSRDVIERIANLQEIDPLDDDGKAELDSLVKLQAEAEPYAKDWQYGSQLIRYSYFKEYAQQFAEDIGAIDANATWPNNCIDWDEAARELQVDYTEVDFDGVSYFVR